MTNAKERCGKKMVVDWFTVEEYMQPIYDNLEEFSIPCYVCGEPVPKDTKNHLYCSGACEFYMMNDRGAFLIGDHPELVRKRIYTT